MNRIKSSQVQELLSTGACRTLGALGLSYLLNSGFSVEAARFCEKKWLTSSVQTLKLHQEVIDIIKANRNENGLSSAYLSLINSIIDSGQYPLNQNETRIVPPYFENNQHPIGSVQLISEVDEVVASDIPVQEYVEDNRHDLEVKFLDCYGMVEGNVVCFRGFEESEAGVNVHYRPVKVNGMLDGTKVRKYDKEVFDTRLPILGLINHKDGVILVERTHKMGSPSKYRKALRADNLVYSDLCAREHTALGLSSITNYDKEDILKLISHSLFKPTLFSYEEALSSVLNLERLAAAFSSSLCLRIDSYSNKIILNKYKWNIGEFNTKTKEIDLYVNTFKKDLDSLGIKYKEAA